MIKRKEKSIKLYWWYIHNVNKLINSTLTELDDQIEERESFPAVFLYYKYLMSNASCAARNSLQDWVIEFNQYNSVPLRLHLHYIWTPHILYSNTIKSTIGSNTPHTHTPNHKYSHANKLHASLGGFLFSSFSSSLLHIQFNPYACDKHARNPIQK